MNRFDGTAARQLELVDEGNTTLRVRPERRERTGSSLRLLQKDMYTELARRRRRAQITARHLIDADALGGRS